MCAVGVAQPWLPTAHIGATQAEEMHERTAEQKAGPIDWSLMRWLNGYMAAGYSRRLELEDEMGLAGRDSGPALFLKFEAAWAQQKSSGRAPSVLRGFWSVLGRHWMLAVVFNWLGVGLQLSGPIVIRRLVVFVEASQAGPLCRVAWAVCSSGGAWANAWPADLTGAAYGDRTSRRRRPHHCMKVYRSRCCSSCCRRSTRC
jgi:hypothetical protein